MKYRECLEEVIKRAHKSIIQSCVNLRSPETLGYAYRDFIASYFNVKRDSLEFGLIVSEMFDEFKTNKIEAEEVSEKLRYHYARYKYCFSPDLKAFHKEEYNKLVDIEKELYKPVRKFVSLCNKLRKK